MDETHKMLRAILSEQNSFREELIQRLNALDMKLSSKIDGFGIKFDNLIINLTGKLDIIEKRLTYFVDAKKSYKIS